jgi:hypothetical protein
MSIPKEKTILLKIKEILEDRDVTLSPLGRLWLIQNEIGKYKDPGYIGGPIVGEDEGDDQAPMEYYENGGK